jgi:hypothetical protein
MVFVRAIGTVAACVLSVLLFTVAFVVVRIYLADLGTTNALGLGLLRAWTILSPLYWVLAVAISVAWFGCVCDTSTSQWPRWRASVDRCKIQMHEPLKTLGEFTVPVKLHKDVPAHLKVVIEKEAVVGRDVTSLRLLRVLGGLKKGLAHWAEATAWRYEPLPPRDEIIALKTGHFLCQTPRQHLWKMFCFPVNHCVTIT